MEANELTFQLVRDQKWDDVVKVLKEYDDLDVNIRDNNNNYLITYAVLFNKIDIVSLLIHKGSKLDVTDNDGRSILFIAIKYGYNKILDLLLKFNKTHIGISLVDIQDNNGNIPLHYAINSQNLYAINDLLESQSNINHADNNGYTSLHLAIHTKNIEICKLILAKNININAKTNTGETALHIACNLELINLVELLIENNIDINLQDYDNEFTALSYSVNRNNPMITALLLKNNADPNIQDFYGNTALHYAIIENNMEIFKQLLESNYTKDIINLNLYNADSKLPIHIAIDSISNKTVEYLNHLVSKSNINFQDNNGNSALHGLAKNGLWKKYISILSKKKLNIFAKNMSGKTVVDYLNSNDYEEFVMMVADSYLYQLRNKPYTWKESWENICRKQINYNDLSEDEKLELNKYVKKNSNDDVCKKIITKKLLDAITNKENGNSYPYKEGRIDININEGKELEFCTFTGITLDILIGTIILLQNHKNACSTITSNFMHNKDLCKYYKQLGVISETKCEFLNFELVWVYQKLYLSDNFVEQFKKCQKKNIRFIIIPLGIELREGSHANYLIYDKKLNEIERFEPHGSNHPYKFNYNQNLLDNILKTRFETMFEATANKIKYIKPSDYLPKIGFQIFDSYENSCRKIGDPKGFCALWSLWYAHMRMTYPDIPRKILVEKIIKKIKEKNISFKNMIRNYSDEIISLRTKIFIEAKLNINDWINDQYTDTQLNTVVDIIKKIINSLV